MQDIFDTENILKIILILFFCLVFALIFNQMTQKHTLFEYTAPYRRIHSERPDTDQDLFIGYDKLIEIMDDPDYLIVDTRSIEEYEEDHIPNAVPFPVYEFDLYFDEFINNYPPFLTLILYCSDIHCDMAKELYYMLKNSASYENIMIYKEGYFGFIERYKD